MDENKEVSTELEETGVTPETEADEDGAIYDDDDDAEWDNVKWEKDDDDEDEAGTDADAKEPEADQQKEPAEEKPAKDEAQSAGEEDTDQWLELKHMDDAPRRVSKEEAKVLAQKGLDYDRIRAERDALKADSARFAEMEKFLGELKGDYASIDDMIDEVRAKMLREKDASLTEEASKTKAREMRSVSVMKPQPSPEELQRQRSNQAVSAFVARYPTVKASDIPKSVWDEVKRTGNLVDAYSRYETQQLKDANKKLQDELDTLKQNYENEKRSAGSAKSAGSKSGKSTIQELWDADD